MCSFSIAGVSRRRRRNSTTFVVLQGTSARPAMLISKTVKHGVHFHSVEPGQCVEFKGPSWLLDASCRNRLTLGSMLRVLNSGDTLPCQLRRTGLRSPRPAWGFRQSRVLLRPATQPGVKRAARTIWTPACAATKNLQVIPHQFMHCLKKTSTVLALFSEWCLGPRGTPCHSPCKLSIRAMLAGHPIRSKWRCWGQQAWPQCQTKRIGGGAGAGQRRIGTRRTLVHYLHRW